MSIGKVLFAISLFCGLPIRDVSFHHFAKYRRRAEVAPAKWFCSNGGLRWGRADITSDIACFFSNYTLFYIGRLEGMPPSWCVCGGGVYPPWGGGSVLGGSVRR